MKIGKLSIGPWVLVARFYQLLGIFWPVPFWFYAQPIILSGRIPRPFKPRTLQDIILKNMIIPDNPDRAIVADKIAARGWAMEKIGLEYLIPLYDVCDTSEEIAQKNYPYPYVVKTNHASAQCCFVKNDGEREKMLKTIKKWNVGEYNPRREWVYRGIKQKFLVEPMLVDADQPEILDIKLYSFFGETILVNHIFDRENGTQRKFFTPDWQPLNIHYQGKCHQKVIKRPENLDEILRLGEVLAADFDFCRVDFMICGDKIYFGELTSFPAAGCAFFHPKSFETYLFGEYQRIRQEKIDSTRAKYHDQIQAQKTH